MSYKPANPNGQATMANSEPVVIASDQSTLSVQGASTILPTDTDSFIGIRTLPQTKTRFGFDAAISGNVASGSGLTLITTGTGSSLSQANGSLIISAGTTARSETIVRSTQTWNGDLTLRYSTILSQRDTNNNFYIELVDIIGDGLSYTINSATSITVTLPGNTFTSQNVGQSMTIGNFSGTGTFVSGIGTIASVAGNNITFTVAGFAAGSGTCSLWGWNTYAIRYTSTTATNTIVNIRRNGYSSGNITAAISSTSGAGHIGILNAEDGIATYLDQLDSSSVTVQTSVRAQSSRNAPNIDTPLYLQIRSANGTTAPTATTWTIGFIDIENYVPQQVSLTSVRSQSFNSAQPVSIQGTPAVTVASTTLTAVTPGVTATSLGKSEDAAHTTGDVGVAVWSVRRDTLNGGATTSANGDYQQISTDLEGVAWTRNVAVYNSIPPTVTNTNKTDLQTDVNANLRITNAPGSFFQALYNDVDISVKASAGVFKSVIVTNINSAVRYFQVINKASAPAGGDTALFSVPIPAGSSTSPGYVILDTTFFGLAGLSCSTGVAIGISTTADTFTAATTTDHTVSGTYV